MRSGTSIIDRTVADACTCETAAHDRLAAAPSGKLTEASPEKAFSSYDAPFATWIGPGGREERRKAHHEVMGDGGAPEGTCAKEGRKGDRALNGEGGCGLGLVLLDVGASSW
jgi:hypothetical protein